MLIIKNYAVCICSALLFGCATIDASAPHEVRYQKIENDTSVGYIISSSLVMYDIEVYGECAGSDRQYVIKILDRSTKTEAKDPKGLLVFDKPDGAGLLFSGGRYDESKFKPISKSLGFARLFSPDGPVDRVGLSSSSGKLSDLPSLCKAKQDGFIAHEKAIYEQANAENERLIDSVIERTGVQPMLIGKNFKDFNNLVTLFQENGITSYKGKFVWVADGDYRVAQVVGSRVLLVSMTNPSYFPTITIITGKEVLEGQLWSSVSKGPLELIGTETYETVLGSSRQTIVFKSI